MGTHCHHQHEAEKNISKAFWLNFFFVLIEFIGGTLTNSSAIIADAIHDLGDTVSLALAWYLQKISSKKSSKNYSYGYQRFSLLSSVISAVVILSGSLFVIINTLSNLNTKSLPNGQGMLLLAILGVSINGWAAWKLSRGNSLNEQMLKWHLVEDSLGWVVVLIGSIAIMIFKITWLDPLMAIVLSLFILWNVTRQLIKTFKVLLQATPEEFNQEQLKDKICAVDGIDNIHDIHSWSLDGQRHILSLHLKCDPSIYKTPQSIDTLIDIKKQVRDIIKQQGDYHTTIEIDLSNENCPHTDCTE